jgi:hypothetical protein
MLATARGECRLQREIISSRPSGCAADPLTHAAATAPASVTNGSAHSRNGISFIGPVNQTSLR